MSPFDEEYVIEKINDRLDIIENKVENTRIDIAALNIKAGIWGFMAGLIPAIGIALMYLISLIKLK